MIGAASLAEAGASVFTARVMACHERDGHQRWWVREGDGEAFEVLALRQAVSGARPGENVLVLRSPEGGAWIIGVVGGEPEPAPRRLQEPGGAAAELVEDEAGIRLRVRDRRGALLFEHDPGTGRSTARVSEGDLDLEVAQGDLSLAAAGRLHLDADRVSIRGRRGVNIDVDGGAGPSGRSRLELGPDCMRLAAHRLFLVARDTQLLSGLARVSVDSLELGARCASAAFTTVEVAADRLRQRVNRSYSYVRDLLHVRAGRSWTEVAGALRLRGATATLRARGRVKVDGESVHLG
ncbi:DUF3540 domain-containing protein [Ectothiorhodospiraceae bacterium WFHF3C12]|nr:DUF3540 domain-containing protein [Ectothiorhodospiraceae bacterium WFHF3C12]